LVKRVDRHLTFPSVVYVDYDTICIRPPKGKDITFRMLPSIDIDNFVENFDLREYRRRYFGRFALDTLLVPLPPVSYEINLEGNTPVYFEFVTMREIGSTHGISESEMRSIYYCAEWHFLSAFHKRLSNPSTPPPKPRHRRIVVPCV